MRSFVMGAEREGEKEREREAREGYKGEVETANIEWKRKGVVTQEILMLSIHLS